MEIEQLRKELNDLLDNVVEHSSNYSGNRQIPSLEISYVLTKINKMQETLIILKHLLKEEERQIKKDKQKEIQQSQENVVKEVKVEVTYQTESIEEEKIPDVEETPIDRAEEIKEVIKEQVEEEIVTTINETTEEIKDFEGPITQTESSTKLKANMEHLPIAKLVDAFSLNDRYLYANELFDKDMAAFNEAVKNIDACANFDEAQRILMENGTQRNWDVEDKHVLSFTNLVERRFL
jgi:phage terminase small subunit